jgi:hypothetical protein
MSRNNKSCYSDKQEFDMNRGKRFIVAGLIFLFAAFLPAKHLFAGNAVLTWNKLTTDAQGNPITELTGYKIYYGASPRTGNNPPGGYNGESSPVTVPGNPAQPTYTFSDLTDGHIYYFSVAAYNSAGTGSFSGESAIPLCSNISVKIEGEEGYYSSIKSAYDSLESDGVLQILAIGFAPRLVLDNARNLKLKGGLACDYSSALGFTNISGLTVIRGSVTVDRILIK